MSFPISICYRNVTVFILRENAKKTFLQLLTDLFFHSVPGKEWFDYCFLSMNEPTRSTSLLCWTHSSFSSSLHSNRQHGNATGNAAPLFVEFLEGEGILWTWGSSEHPSVRFCTMSLYLGWKGNCPLGHKIIFFSQILYPRDERVKYHSASDLLLYV